MDTLMEMDADMEWGAWSPCSTKNKDNNMSHAYGVNDGPEF